MLGTALHGGLAAQGGVRVDQFVGTEGAAAFLALVAVGALIAALGTGAHDIAVCQELLGIFVIVLFALFLDKFPLIIELAEEL